MKGLLKISNAEGQPSLSILNQIKSNQIKSNQIKSNQIITHQAITLIIIFYVEQHTGNLDIIMLFIVFTFSTHFGSVSAKSSFKFSGRPLTDLRNMNSAERSIRKRNEILTNF